MNALAVLKIKWKDNPKMIFSETKQINNQCQTTLSVSFENLTAGAGVLTLATGALAAGLNF